MIDLVERLRAYRQECGIHHDQREVEVCVEAAAEIASLRTALSQEREAREKAEAQLSLAREVLAKIAAPYDGQGETRLIPLAELGSELRKRQKIASAFLGAQHG
jgi:hypothetical protein